MGCLSREELIDYLFREGWFGWEVGSRPELTLDCLGWMVSGAGSADCLFALELMRGDKGDRLRNGLHEMEKDWESCFFGFSEIGLD